MFYLILAGILLGAPIDVFDPDAGAFLESTAGADELFAMADSVYREADYAAAAEYYLTGLREQPGNSSAIYNLACCYGLLDRADLAARYLGFAWNAGFDNIDHIKDDPDFDAVREEPVFVSLVDSLSELAAEQEEWLGEEITFYARAPFTCRVRVPEGYDGSGPLPLVLGIHGYGGSPEQFIGLWEVIGDYNCIYAVPRGPVPFPVGGRLGYSWFTGYDEASRVESSVASRNYVLSLIDTLEEEYAVSDVYLFGYSQGGGMTFLTGLHAPERFTAMAPFSGWLDMSVLSPEELSLASAVPVRIVHGEQDRVVDYQSALEADSILSSLGYDVELFTFAGEHRFSTEGLSAFLEEFLSAP